MMTGTVNADLEALLRLTVRDASDQPKDAEAVIDTGFNGFLTLPPALIGMALMQGSELRIQVVPGGSVTIAGPLC